MRTGSRYTLAQVRTVQQAFTDDGVETVVHPVLVLPQQYHDRVVRAAVDTKMQKRKHKKHGVSDMASHDDTVILQNKQGVGFTKDH